MAKLRNTKVAGTRQQRKARMMLDPKIDPRGDHLERMSQEILASRRNKHKNV